VPAACATGDDAEQRPDRELEPLLEPGVQLLPTPGVHADLSTPTSLSSADEQGASSLIEISLGERKRFLDAQSRSPQDDDQPAQPPAVRGVAGGAHDGDDLFHLRRIRRVAQTLVARRSTGVKSGHGRRRSTSASTVEQ
jgi:hypothetical protein